MYLLYITPARPVYVTVVSLEYGLKGSFCY